VQAATQLLDLTSWTFGEHADRAHTDHDLAGWADDVGNFDPTPGEADVNALPPPVSQASGYVKVNVSILPWVRLPAGPARARTLPQIQT